MRRCTWISCLAIVFSSSLTVAAELQSSGSIERKPLFERSGQSEIKENGATAQWTEIDGKPGIKFFSDAEKNWPGVFLKAPQGKWDLSQYEYVSLDIHNIDTHDIDIFINVENPRIGNAIQAVGERVGLAPDQKTTLTIQLKRVSNSPIKLFGMASYPQGLSPGKAALDVTNVTDICVFTAKTPTTNNFTVSNIYASGKYTSPKWLDMTEKEFFPFIDKYGQFKHKDWPGKIHSDEELIARRDAEAKQLAEDKGPASWNKWGGWNDGPTLEATGHFRVEKYQGKWWFVDPDGKLYFSTGITGAAPRYGAGVIEDRANWFEDLPAKDGPLKNLYGRSYKVWSGHYAGKEPETFDFGAQNLIRKYGEDYRKTYPELIHKRFRAWGINSFGNWSDGNLCRMGGTPYTMTFYYTSKRLKTAHSGFPDVFSPDFRPALVKGAKQFLNGTTEDPWCIGYFLDNEMPWGGETTLALDTLKTAADQPAKLEMVRWLKERYPEIAALNSAWGTKFESYDAFLNEKKVVPKGAAAEKDLTAFTEWTAETYFKTVDEVLTEIAPKKLYLGCRCVGGSVNVIASAIKYCDVVSYNRYCHSIKEVKFPGGLDGPMMIGEFHFGALDRGLFGTGLVSADSQATRAQDFIGYVRSGLQNSQMVGVHWFQYADSPTMGRGDGENHQIGFIDVCDTPYEETIKASRAIAETMYTERMSAK